MRHDTDGRIALTDTERKILMRHLAVNYKYKK